MKNEKNEVWYSTNLADIQPVIVVSESDLFVTLENGARRKKVSEFEGYYPTYEQARHRMIGAAEDNVARAERNLEIAQSGLTSVSKKAPLNNPHTAQARHLMNSTKEERSAKYSALEKKILL